MHAPIKEAYVSMDRAARNDGIRVFLFRNSRCQKLITPVRRVELRPIGNTHPSSVARANQDYGSVQLIAHGQDVGWQDILVIVRPHSGGQTDLFEIAYA